MVKAEKFSVCLTNDFIIFEECHKRGKLARCLDHIPISHAHLFQGIHSFGISEKHSQKEKKRPEDAHIVKVLWGQFIKDFLVFSLDYLKAIFTN